MQLHDTPLSTAAFTAKLAEINPRFDALRPPRLKVRVRHYIPYFAVYVSDCGHPALFDPDEGFIGDGWVPPELARKASVATKD